MACRGWRYSGQHGRRGEAETSAVGREQLRDSDSHEVHEEGGKRPVENADPGDQSISKMPLRALYSLSIYVEKIL